MKTFKNLLVLLILLVSVTTYAQTTYEIHTTTVSEKFNSKNELQSRHIWASGVQGDDILNVDMIVDRNNIVKELTLNDKKVIPVRLKEYRDLTNYVINYVDGNIKIAPNNGTAKTTKVTTEEPKEADKMTDSDKRALMDLIKSELIKDELIDNPKVFDFLLTADSLYINAKKQEATIFQKYKDLYDRYSDLPLSKTTYFQITQTL